MSRWRTSPHVTLATEGIPPPLRSRRGVEVKGRYPAPLRSRRRVVEDKGRYPPAEVTGGSRSKVATALLGQVGRGYVSRHAGRGVNQQNIYGVSKSSRGWATFLPQENGVYKTPVWLKN